MYFSSLVLAQVIAPMPILMDSILRYYFSHRQRQVDDMARNAIQKQAQLLQRIITRNTATEYGLKNDFSSIDGKISSYKRIVPLVTYEQLAEDIDRMIAGEKNILTPVKVRWYAKSSGTTNARSKYIPTTDAYLRHGHLKCTWTAASVIYNEDKRARLFENKTLIMGGSLEEISPSVRAGDVSAIMLYNFPKIGRRFYTPDFGTAVLEDWDEKIEAMARICSQEKVTLIGGVPTWLMVLLEKILDYSGKSNISQVWPTLRSVIHGGMSFEPYEKKYKELIPSDKVAFREVYNSSEGYFALQDKKDIDGMLLLCDHEIYYEFIPAGQSDLAEPEVVDLKDIELFQPYEMVISNTSGLYRYRIGDVVEFVSNKPHRIKHLGRTQQNINVFGEELMLHNTDRAMTMTCSELDLQLIDYTVAPIFPENERPAGHEWAIELAPGYLNKKAFAELLDKNLRSLNSDYDAKRYKDLVIATPDIHFLSHGTIHTWQKKNKKYGGQNKMARLNTERQLLEELIELSISLMEESKISVPFMNAF